ncbi:MAG TPA: hypothetical protein VI895_02495, partial [Bdellovibrionota bacterium]|nr:hypothetical protein [Bdellovibrionota bacterium]
VRVPAGSMFARGGWGGPVVAFLFMLTYANDVGAADDGIRRHSAAEADLADHLTETTSVDDYFGQLHRTYVALPPEERNEYVSRLAAFLNGPYVEPVVRLHAGPIGIYNGSVIKYVSCEFLTDRYDELNAKVSQGFLDGDQVGELVALERLLKRESDLRKTEYTFEANGKLYYDGNAWMNSPISPKTALLPEVDLSWCSDYLEGGYLQDARRFPARPSSLPFETR